MILNKIWSRKIRRLQLRANNNSGIIIIIVLWVLVILTLLAVGLGRRASLEIALTRHSVGRLKAKYLAWAGLVYSMKQIKADSEDEETKKFDALEMCAVNLGDDQIDKKFEGRILGDGYFDVAYVNGEDGTKRIGLSDEERKINLNAITGQNRKVLESLILIMGFSEDDAKTITASVIDWRDENDRISFDDFGAEDEYYMSLEKPYHCKNRPIESFEELLLVRGMREEIFSKIKKHITIYPKQGSLRVNFNTASETVLKAFAYSVSGEGTAHDLSDADSLSQKIVDSRAKDKPLDMNDLGLNNKEKTIFLNVVNARGYKDDVSRNVRVEIKGVDKNSSVESNIKVIVYRDDLSVLYWHTN